jgi:metallo-beta-lactamase class B
MQSGNAARLLGNLRGTRMSAKKSGSALTLLVLLSGALPAVSTALGREAGAINQPITPVRIADQLYYVGTSDVASYLLVTPAGDILIDGGFAQSAPIIEANIAALGFRITDVKWLLNGHAHPDHAGGLSQLKRDSGARFAAMNAEVIPLEHNGQGTFYRGDKILFDSVAVDRVLRDGDHIDIGGIRLTAHLTAGHTPGCTTWTTQLRDRGKKLSVVIACQISVPAANISYAGMDVDFQRTYALLRSLPCDIFLAEHGKDFSLTEKMARSTKDTSVNPFVDPSGCVRYVDDAEVLHSPPGAMNLNTHVTTDAVTLPSSN